MKIAIVLNAPYLNVEIEEENVICADGGYRYMEGKRPIAIVGDLDSLDGYPKDIVVVKHPVEKDSSDGELAVRYAVEQGADEIVIYGALGGRYDHVLGNFSLLALADELGVKAVIRDRRLNAYYTETSLTLQTKGGDTVSVFPFGNYAIVKTASGLYYPLNELKLEPSHATRGLSNFCLGQQVSLELSFGAVLVLHLSAE